MQKHGAASRRGGSARAVKQSAGSQIPVLAVCLFLAVAISFAFWPAFHCGFVNFDDDAYITANPHVQQGLNWNSVGWALTTFDAANWHPLTWLSHIFDFQLYGLQPAGHHVTSLLLHLANSILLFLVLRELTGAFGRSALVAALFAVHPLRVESVVWVAERKDVLSTFFGMLTLWAYVRYARERDGRDVQGKVFYRAALVFFALGLMAKPMLVTLPFVLLLLDVWPLRRWQAVVPCSWQLIKEKIPFFVLAVGSSAVTLLVQNSAGAVKSLFRFSFGQRLANVPVSYARYLGKIFWPENLAVFYPPRRWQAWEVAGATLALALVSGWVLWQWRARPYLAVGWFWFLGTLVPVIGFVQTGDQALADRYSYVPCVGVLIMVVWGIHEMAAPRPFVVGGGLAVVICAVLTWRQAGYWKDSVTLFSRAINATGRNYIASYNLGCAALAKGDYPKAVEYFEEALLTDRDEIFWGNPAPVHNNLGAALLQGGRIAQAVAHFDEAVAIQPSFPEAYYNMGRAFLTNHQPDVAIDCFRHGLATAPNVPDLNYSLGETLLGQGRPAEALPCLERAVEVRPAFALAHEKLADALTENGRVAEGVPHYRRARELALAQGNRALAAAAEARLSQYDKMGAASK
jgi:Tfp pilus assembly protein PilF